jgi:hypothetical protein
MNAPAANLSEQLIAELRTIFARDPDSAQARSRVHLATRLAGLSADAGRQVLLGVQRALQPAGNQPPELLDSDIATRVFGLILGRKVTAADLSSEALIERLAHSLNTVFNELNSLVGVINATLSGGAAETELTIRQVIGSHIGSDDQTKPLEDYLGQIRQAFLTTQEAFKKAAHNKVAQILASLDPEKLAAERSGGLKIGPLRKAEDFDLLKSKIDRIQKWFESGRFMEDFLREFEKNCNALVRV